MAEPFVFSVISGADQGTKTRLLSKRDQIDVNARTGGGELWQALRHAFQRFERAVAIASKRMETRDVVAGKWIVSAVCDA